MRPMLRWLTVAALAALLLPLAPPLAGAADLPPATAVAGGKRVALVIGNQFYRNPPLAKPAADARAVADALSKIGFDVTTVVDAGGEDLHRAVDAAATRAKEADVSVLYYSGFGVRGDDGTGYLVPVDLSGSEDAVTVQHKALRLEYALERLRPQSGALVAFLDTCFPNPWRREKGAGSASLTPAIHPGSFIFLASTTLAAEGSAAEPLSPFTSHLVPALLTPGVEIAQAMAPVVGAVARATDGLQVPVFHYSLTAPLHLVAVE